MAWQGNGMGAAWARHAMFESALRNMDRKRFVTDIYVKQAVPSFLQTLHIDFLYAWKQYLVLGWDECLSASGEYMGVWCVSSAAHVKKHRSQNEVLGIRLFLTKLQKNFVLGVYMPGMTEQNPENP
jgi:hypothetical protein